MSEPKCATCGGPIVSRTRGNSRNPAKYCTQECAVQRGNPPVPAQKAADPVTSDRYYSDEEFEFMKAMEQFKKENKVRFPTCGQVLEVLRGLGYKKVPN